MEFGLTTGFITGELNVQRMDLEERLKAIKLRQEDSIHRLGKIKHSEIEHS